MPQVLLPNKTIEYTIKRNLRSRSVRITVHPDLRLAVSAPYFVPEKTVVNFVEARKEWIEEKLSNYEKIGPIKKIGAGVQGGYKKNKEIARAFIKERINKINAYYNFSFNRVAIKNSRSRWGSCSKKRNLNFNYKIIFLPEHLADYIIAHELCHLKEMNHSKKFWDLVALSIPNWHEYRKELHKNIM